jgi:hypothetical protein
MIHEKRLDAYVQLRDELRNLDPDGGIRLHAWYRETKCFAFVNRSRAGYVIAVHRVKKAKKCMEVPGKRLDFKEFGSLDDAASFLESIAASPFEAYLY